ncbi:MAG: cation diffusion facilitator family transporter [Candidatus Nomurabacteria bacterium]|jgi:cation diffusion facilitator family transporter|nr:cation diffusion facilitator family transporter [Candidatus Nomurabacteria bacterium]
MKPKKQTSERQRIGQRVGLVSLFLSIVLSAAKFIIGALSNSIAVMADAFNNLTDCVSAIASFLGFRLAHHRDQNHPYGHGRMEYVAGLTVSMVIIVTAFSVGEAAIRRLVSPEPVDASSVALTVCVVAIAVKIGMAVFVKLSNRKVHSQTLAAAARDNISDTLATSVALLSLLLAPHTDLPVDGLLGIVVSAFILYSGIKSFLDNLELILGKGLTPKEAREIRAILGDYDIVEYATDLDVHDYGPESKILLAKVHLAKSPHSKEFKNEMMRIKREINKGFGFDETIIYWPPAFHEADGDSAKSR